MRSMLNQVQKLSPYDEDCLLIAHSERFLTAGMCPNYKDVENTPFHKRGWELEEMLYGPIIPYHVDTKAQRRTWASIAFEEIHHREPVVGDVLRYGEVEGALPAKRYKLLFEAYEKAWKRRLPDLTLPFKFEDGKLFKRVREDGGTITWEEDADIQPRQKWYYIEAEALGTWSAPKPPDPPSIRAVMFVESPDMKHRTKPLVGLTTRS